jgi:hypothetical protein
MAHLCPSAFKAQPKAAPKKARTRQPEPTNKEASHLP